MTRESDSLWDSVIKDMADRATEMPDQKAAIETLWRAYHRLEELGWSDASGCPKDGSEFMVIEAGGTGIFRCTYQGEWPNGTYLIADGVDIWPSHPILFRLYPAAEMARKIRMKAAMEQYARDHDVGSGGLDEQR